MSYHPRPSMVAPRLGVVNGLRGVAILAVIWHHFGRVAPTWRAPVVAGWPLPWASFLTNGWLGVNLFFMLSGLVLYLPYAQGTRTLEEPHAIRDFYRRRAQRLLPLYYVSLVVVWIFLVHPTLDAGGLEEVGLATTLTFVFTKAHFAPRFNSSLWSLGIEVWVSVLFPVLIVGGKRLGARRLLLYVALLALAVRCAGVAIPAFDRPHNPYLNPLKDSALGRLDDFVVGMVIAELVVARSWLEARRARWLAPLGLLALWTGCALWDLRATGHLPKAVTPFLDIVVDAGLFAITCAAIASRGLLHRLLSSGLLQVPGKMCYSLYVWQGIVLRALIHPDYGLADVALFVVFLAALSATTYRYIEFRHERDWRALFRGS